MSYLLKLSLAILFFAPSLATAKATCYVPNHPNICPQIIGLLDKMRSEGKLTVQEWDGITLNVAADNPYFTKSGVQGGEQYGAVFYEPGQNFGFNGYSSSLMTFLTGKQNINHAATNNQLQNFEQGITDQLVLRYWSSTVRIDNFEPNRDAAHHWRNNTGIKLNSNYQPSPGAYMAIPTQMTQTNLGPMPMNQPVIAPPMVPNLTPNQAPPKIVQSVPTPMAVPTQMTTVNKVPVPMNQPVIAPPVVPNLTPNQAPPKIVQSVPTPMAVPTQMTTVNKVPVPMNQPVIAPPMVPNLTPNQAPPKIAQSVPTPMAVPTQMTTVNKVPVPMNQPVIAPPVVPNLTPNQAPPKIVQKTPSVMVAKSGKPSQSPKLKSLPQKVHLTRAPKGVKTDVRNLNQHFTTRYAGDHIDRNERAYMVDSDEKLWGCKIAGITARKTLNDEGEYEMHGHFETTHYKNRFLAHVPAVHGHRKGCLISVHK